MVVQKQHSGVVIAPNLELPTRFPEVALLRKDVKFDSYDLVLVPEPGRCFELCPVVFSDPSQLAWLLTTAMVFPSGAVFHSKACVSSLVLDASSSWDCALPVLHPAARRYNQKDQKQQRKVKEGQYCLGFPCHSTGSVAAAVAVKRHMEDAAAASLCATSLPNIALSVFWFLSCFDVFGTVVVPSFLHGLGLEHEWIQEGELVPAAAALNSFCASVIVGVLGFAVSRASVVVVIASLGSLATTTLSQTGQVDLHRGAGRPRPWQQPHSAVAYQVIGEAAYVARLVLNFLRRPRRKWHRGRGGASDGLLESIYLP